MPWPPLRRVLPPLALGAALHLAPALAGAEHAVPGMPFRLAVPADWRAAETAAPGTLAVLRGPGTGDAQPAVAVTVTDAAGADAAAAARRLLDQVRDHVPAYAELEPPATVAIAGRTWVRARYRFTTGATVWEQVAHVTVAEGRAWLVTGSVLAEEAPRWRSTLEGLVGGE